MDNYDNPLEIADKLIGIMTYSELLVLRHWIDDELDYLESY